MADSTPARPAHKVKDLDLAGPTFVGLVDEGQQLRLEVTVAPGDEGGAAEGVPPSGQLADVVAQEMQGDVLDRPAGADGGPHAGRKRKAWGR